MENLEILLRLKQAKQSRKQAEEDAEKIAKRIKRLRDKQVSSQKRIEILRDVSLKVKKIRDEKDEAFKEREYFKSVNQGIVQRNREEIKLRKIEGLVLKEENVRKILKERKNYYLVEKEKKKNDEDFVRSRIETCAEINALVKNEIFLRKDQVLKQREFEWSERKMKTRQDFEMRVERERGIVDRKMLEKSLMQDVDLGVLERLQSNKFFES
jgi:hypothetical protein